MDNKNKNQNFRLLPVVIFTAVLMLSVKIGDIWSNIDNSSKVEISISESMAADDKKTEKNKDGEDEIKINNSELGNVDLSKGNVERETKKEVNNGDMFSQSELSILQDLANRREEIEEREASIDKKIVQMKAAERQLEQKIIKLKEYEEKIKRLLGQYDEKESKKMAGLVKLYSTMKPKDAARIFNGLEMDILINMIENMKSTTAAAILSKMDSDKAKVLTAELANRKSLSK